MPERIFIIEDEEDIEAVIAYNLQREGFVVTSANDGKQGYLTAKKEKPDLILLDLMLPGMNGLDVCRSLKTEEGTKHIPIIMITAKGDESDIVLGLGLGADDYVTKPFSTKELVARAKAVLRRTKKKAEPVASALITHLDITLDPERHKVQVAGEDIVFTATEFKVVQVLMAQPGRVFTREQLLNVAVGENIAVIDRNIDVHIRSIRKKLGEEKQYIETIRGVGYRLRD